MLSMAAWGKEYRLKKGREKQGFWTGFGNTAQMQTCGFVESGRSGGFGTLGTWLDFWERTFMLAYAFGSRDSKPCPLVRLDRTGETLRNHACVRSANQTTMHKCNGQLAF